MCNVVPSPVLKDVAIEEVAFLPCSKVNLVQKPEEVAQAGHILSLVHHYDQTNDSSVHLLGPV